LNEALDYCRFIFSLRNESLYNNYMADVDLGELEHYLRIFQENPDSRVFAPLADLYRRLGRMDDAERICREGLRRHPYYAGGRVALAHILFDRGLLKEAFDEVESIVTYYPDNLLARKILIKTLISLGQRDRAQREMEALKSIAPEVAADPELYAFFKSGAPSARRFESVSDFKPQSILEGLKLQAAILQRLIASI
jgi:tetratricopeptide (TPR) repeat protein